MRQLTSSSSDKRLNVPTFPMGLDKTISTALKGGTQPDALGMLPEGFTGSGTSDEAMVVELHRRLDEQNKELEQRNNVVSALQRNFESLSTLCMTERNENKNLKKFNESLRKENQEFVDKVTSLNNRIALLEKDSEALIKEKKRSTKLNEENQYQKMQIESLNKQLDRKS